MTDIYIIFDSPPGDGPSNFVDVEDGDGDGLSPEQTGATWRKLGDQSWALGPFAAARLADASATMDRELGAARQRADDLREALASFGRHDDGCVQDGRRCTCGLFAAIAAEGDGETA